jgi:hypothetical protein
MLPPDIRCLMGMINRPLMSGDSSFMSYHKRRQLYSIINTVPIFPLEAAPGDPAPIDPYGPNMEYILPCRRLYKPANRISDGSGGTEIEMTSIEALHDTLFTSEAQTLLLMLNNTPGRFDFSRHDTCNVWPWSVGWMSYSYRHAYLLHPAVELALILQFCVPNGVPLRHRLDDPFIDAMALQIVHDDTENGKPCEWTRSAMKWRPNTEKDLSGKWTMEYYIQSRKTMIPMFTKSVAVVRYWTRTFYDTIPATPEILREMNWEPQDDDYRMAETYRDGQLHVEREEWQQTVFCTNCLVGMARDYCSFGVNSHHFGSPGNPIRKRIRYVQVGEASETDTPDNETLEMAHLLEDIDLVS